MVKKFKKQNKDILVYKDDNNCSDLDQHNVRKNNKIVNKKNNFVLIDDDEDNSED